MKNLVKGLMLTSLCATSVFTLASCGEEGTTSDEPITINLGGSTSVEKIAKALSAEFELECPKFDAVHNHTGSGDAYKRTQGSDKNSATNLHIGFLSRDLKAEETATEGTSGLVCKDGIVAVVNAKNSAVTNVTGEDLTTLYSTKDVTWASVAEGTSDFDTKKKVVTYTRDTTSGTRDGFFTTIGFKDAVSDDTVIPAPVIASSNGDMITKVKNDPYGLGYISLASLDGSGLKALNYNGVTPTEAGVVDGSYELQRNFNYITRTEADCSKEEWILIQAFMAFMNSQEGLTIIKSNDGILTKNINEAKSWETIKNENPEFKAICE